MQRTRENDLSLYITTYLSFGVGKLTQPVQGTLTCESTLLLYVDGRFISITNDWRKPLTYTLPAGSSLVAVMCKAARAGSGEVGILGSFHNGLVTDSQWKCVQNSKNERGWNRLSFDDSNWPSAVEYFPNRDWTVWNKIKGISDQAFWIWTADKGRDSVVLCRRRLYSVIPLPNPREGKPIRTNRNIC